jgi:hypothetical protein
VAQKSTLEQKQGDRILDWALAPQSAPLIAMRHKNFMEERTMTTLQAFVLGLMVAWTPSLVLLGWLLLLEDRQKGVTEKLA